MAAHCTQTSCCQYYLEMQKLREANKLGIFTPDQINKQVDISWETIAGSHVIVNRE